MGVTSLTSRLPVLTDGELLASLVPPPQFARVSFDSYLADPGEPTQGAAVAALRAFAVPPAPTAGGLRWLRRRSEPPELRPGVYLDGGFGVGKTHLLAALWHDHPGPKAFGTFVEFTNLVGVLGFAPAVAAFAGHRLVCIDEFELDDPGDTVLMSTFLGQLVDNGVRLAATSNTLPDRLGEGRFAADDFLREIQGLSAHFEVLRIDGQDYRHRGRVRAAEVFDDADLIDLAATTPDSAVDDFDALLAHLRRVHPSKYGALVKGLSLLCLRQVHALRDQADALRLVVLVDRLYDRQVAVAGSGHALTEIFPPDMLTGGYRKNYYRCLSRLGALAVQQ
ncbi:MAG: cell division protein ZapE [Actinomycetota bacterium]|nr:cell division protein ZapE [Actinomycetota bacterium]